MHDTDTRALLQTWLAGWASTRGCAPPVVDGSGWRVQVGLPDQVRRHVFASDNDTLRAHGESITEPWIWLKACMHPEALRAIMPPRWRVRTEPSYFMRFEGALPSGRLPVGYEVREHQENGVHFVDLHAGDGTPAARGRIAMVEDSAIFDRIRTDDAHRRRGLGRAVMAALHAYAHSRGATRGLLAATRDGHALYTALGWTVQAPYSSAVIEGAPAA